MFRPLIISEKKKRELKVAQLVIASSYTHAPIHEGYRALGLFPARRRNLKLAERERLAWRLVENKVGLFFAMGSIATWNVDAT